MNLEIGKKMFDIVSGFGKTSELKVITASSNTGKSKLFQQDQPTLEELLMELKQYGKPRVSFLGDGWHCNVEMNTNTVGADFKCASEFGIATPTDAAKQCLERVLKAVEQYRK
jgi:hypothetical protein